MKIRTKICGMTRPEDAYQAAALNVDAIGLIFYPNSKRFINIKQARAIIDVLPPFVTVVALFVNATTEEINNVLTQLPIDILQFHGDESAEFCRQFHHPYIKAIRVHNRHSIDTAITAYPDARALLFDAAVSHAYGGTGQTFDWQCLTEKLPVSWILSGGLKPENIMQAIQITNAIAVDLCSGVEAEAGIKDLVKMQELMHQIQLAGNKINR